MASTDNSDNQWWVGAFTIEPTSLLHTLQSSASSGVGETERGREPSGQHGVGTVPR
jgi:hypothetical protein